MRSDRKLEIQSKKIIELENRIKELEAENSTLETEIENNKSTILSREQLLDEKEKQLDDTQAKFNAMIEEARKIQSYYKNAVAEAEQIRDEYSKKMEKEFKRIRKQKK